MTFQKRSIVAACVLALSFGAAASAGASGDLLTRMIALNPRVHSYEADIHADIHMTSFPFLSPSLDGKVYHKDPSLYKIVFTSGLPGIAKQFGKIYPRIEAPSEWKSVYGVTLVGDTGTVTTFRLVPIKHGRIDHIDVGVNDASATIVSMHWAYNDGSGYADMQQQYALVNGNEVVVKQTGHVEQSIYKADIASTLSNYTFNPSISNAFFTEQ